jgi:UTP-glucose-1-phosphate uridylyltransferase
MSELKMPNPFECAKRIVGVNVMLKPDDIVHACPSVSLATAELFLDMHASIIAVQMLSAGLSAAVEIIKQQGQHHETPRD